MLAPSEVRLNQHYRETWDSKPATIDGLQGQIELTSYGESPLNQHVG